MSIEQAVSYINITANQDMTPAGTLHKAVTVNGTIAASCSLLGGFSKSKSANGQSLRIAIQGVVKVVAGAAVSTVGYPVTVTTSGFVIAATSGGYTMGRAFTTAASGDLFPILADCQNLGTFVS